jgi:sugar phosphate isomerase/epimerase
MEILYTCPYWGQEGISASMFLARVLQDDYDGVEINLPESDDFVPNFQSALENLRAVKHDFVFIAQQVLSPANESVDAYIRRMKTRLEYLMSLHPDFINSHTGKDYFSFDDNCRIIEVAENIAQRAGIRILHETHRGRFTFHASSLLPYLEKFPQLQLTGDFSHWCTVSESLLQDQHFALAKIIPHVRHIHARVGYEHSPQVSDPFAPEWNQHLKIFSEWWRKIIEVNRSNEKSVFTITPEFGPIPYMPTLPYSRKPLSDQWSLNSKMKNLLKRRFEIPVIVRR